jgi:hypothetical protein
LRQRLSNSQEIPLVCHQIKETSRFFNTAIHLDLTCQIYSEDTTRIIGPAKTQTLHSVICMGTLYNLISHTEMANPRNCELHSLASDQLAEKGRTAAAQLRGLLKERVRHQFEIQDLIVDRAS